MQATTCARSSSTLMARLGGDRPQGTALLQYRTYIRFTGAMQFSVRLMRNKGRCLSARELANAPLQAGDLRVEELRDEVLRRHVRVARLVDRTRPRDPDRLQPLYDVTLPAMSPQAFTLAGFERIEGVEYAQSWLVTAPG